MWKGIYEKIDRGFEIGNWAVTEGRYRKKDAIDLRAKIEKKLFDLVIAGLADYVSQQQLSVTAYFIRKESFDELHDDTFHFRNAFIKKITAKQFHELAMLRFKAFSRVDHWIGYLSRKNAVIVTRIHGNILGLQAGVPSIPIVHDSRTSELCQAMSIPSIDVEAAAQISSVNDFLSLFDVFRNFNFSELDEKRRDLLNCYSETISDLGLKISEKYKAWD